MCSLPSIEGKASMSDEVCMTYQQSLDYLASLNTFGMRLGLSRICRLAELLGNPQDAYKTVHITGTNGKGSVSVLAAAALSASGLRTGLFTSPHLVSYNERMCVAGAHISDEEFARMLSRTRDAAERMIAEGEESPTQFEVLTAAAFLYFAEKKVDYAVIEVGLGGLLDSPESSQTLPAGQGRLLLYDGLIIQHKNERNALSLTFRSFIFSYKVILILQPPFYLR